MGRTWGGDWRAVPFPFPFPVGARLGLSSPSGRATSGVNIVAWPGNAMFAYRYAPFDQ